MTSAHVVHVYETDKPSGLLGCIKADEQLALRFESISASVSTSYDTPSLAQRARRLLRKSEQSPPRESQRQVRL